MLDIILTSLFALGIVLAIAGAALKCVAEDRGAIESKDLPSQSVIGDVAAGYAAFHVLDCVG